MGWLETDRVRGEVGSFPIGRVTWNLPGLGIAALVTLVSSGLMWDRFRKIDVTDGSVRQMRLAVIPTHDDDVQGDTDQAPAVAADGPTEAGQSPVHGDTSGGAGTE